MMIFFWARLRRAETNNHLLRKAKYRRRGAGGRPELGLMQKMKGVLLGKNQKYCLSAENHPFEVNMSHGPQNS